MTDNAICGNFSAEYGGAMSAFGYQTNTGGTIRNNRVWFNSSYDEGGAVMVAGELPATPTQLSEGTGPVTIDKNVISENLGNDDGGGIRLLQVSGSHVSRLTPGTVTISNNTVTENISTHEGGGISLDDAAFVDVVGNTVAGNLTTASAMTSDGLPAPAGLSTAQNSDQLQARLRNTTLFPGSQTLAATTFSKPTILDDVFSDNRAGSFSGGWITGIGGKLPDGTDNDINNWDLGLADGSRHPVAGGLGPPDRAGHRRRDQHDGHGLAWVQEPEHGVGGRPRVAHLPGVPAVADHRRAPVRRTCRATTTSTGSSSPAYGRGAASTQVAWGTGSTGWRVTVSAPPSDIDGDARPTVSGTSRRFDAGSDQAVP